MNNHYWDIMKFIMIVIFTALAACGCTVDEGEKVDMILITDTAAGDTDATLCQSLHPFCSQNFIVSCVGGQPSFQECPEGTYCNKAGCSETKVNLPADAAPHDLVMEWWYYTGHLKQKDGAREWGFEVAMFKYHINDTAGDGYMCHVAVLDKYTGQHHYTYSLNVNPQQWQSEPTVLEINECLLQMSGTGSDKVTATIPEQKNMKGEGGWSLELEFTALKPVVYHGEDGVIEMGGGANNSYYYTFPRMEVAGDLQTPEGSEAVVGQAWMDHQWGDFDHNYFKGWDWWSMQLDDDWEIMLFQFRDWDDVLVHQAGTVVYPNGDTTFLEGTEEFTITPLRSWESPYTDGTYPLDWDITIKKYGMDWKLEVRTPVDDQEMPNATQNYWEGMVTITGTLNDEAKTGVGYVELTGYASDPMDPK